MTGIWFLSPVHVQAAYDPTTSMALPFQTGATVYFNGPHNWDSQNHPTWSRNSLDLEPSPAGQADEVYAATSGRVHLNECHGATDYVRIDPSDQNTGWQETYIHLSRRDVSEGQWVNRGDPIGRTGNPTSGCGSGTVIHIHFSIWYVRSGTFSLGAQAQEVDWGGVNRGGADVGNQPVVGDWVWTDGSDQYLGTATNLDTGATASCNNSSGCIPTVSIYDDGDVPALGLNSSSAMGAIAVAGSYANEVFYAFMVRPSDGHLMLNVFNSGWSWVDENVTSADPPAAALTGRVAQISYVDSAGVPRQFAFVRDINGRLYADYFAGTPGSWQWANQSQLSGAPSFVREVVGSAVFIDVNGARQLYVFVIDNSDQLWANYGPESSGHPTSWIDVSSVATPQSSVVPWAGGVGAIAYATPSVRAIYAYGYDLNGHLDLVFSGDGGATWHWYDQNLAGSYPGVAVIGRLGVDAYVNASGVLCVYAFVVGTGGEVYVDFFDGSWKWNDQLMASKATPTATLGVGVTHLGADRSLGVYAAVLGHDGDLWLNYGGFTSSTTSWFQMPKYPGLTPDTDVGATSFIFCSNGAQALYFEALGNTRWSRDLLLDYWYSSPIGIWQAVDQGNIG